jgi:hypothetical protein
MILKKTKYKIILNDLWPILDQVCHGLTKSWANLCVFFPYHFTLKSIILKFLLKLYSMSYFLLSCLYDPVREFWRPHLNLPMFCFCRFLFVNFFIFILICLDFFRLAIIFFFYFFIMSSHGFFSLFKIYGHRFNIVFLHCRKFSLPRSKAQTTYLVNPEPFFSYCLVHVKIKSSCWVLWSFHKHTFVF